MKLKSVPEDFVVNEIAAVKPRASGPYGLYILEQHGWDTAGALRRIAESRGVDYRRFGYGGRMDSSVRSFQYVTFEGQENLTGSGQSCRITRVGFLERPMGPDLVTGNQFRVVMRSLDVVQVPRIRENAAEASLCGFPNYIDDQRFFGMGSTGFVAERMLRAQWRGSVEAYMTASLPGDPDRLFEMRPRMREVCGDWGRMLEVARESGADLEDRMLNLLLHKPGSYLEALQMIPGERLAVLFSAYQAYLWNEILRRFLYEIEGPMDTLPGDAGPYLFYHHMAPDLFAYLLGLEIPLPAADARVTDAIISFVYLRVLEERGINLGCFKMRWLNQASFEPGLRKVIAVPSNLHVGEPVPDELNPGRVRVTVEFFLPSGCYGTTLVKRLSL